MRKAILASFTLLISIISYSQIELGVKGGLNLNFSKEAKLSGTGFFTPPNANFEYNSDNSLGFQFGVVAEIDIQKLGLTFRPEILYSLNNYDFEGLILPESQKLTLQTINVPLLLGKTIKGPFRILFGPSLQFLIDSEFDISEFSETNSDSFTLNAHIGFGLKFEKFDFDIRWEKGITNSETAFRSDFQDAELTFDTKPNRLILSVAYRFGMK